MAWKPCGAYFWKSLAGSRRLRGSISRARHVQALAQVDAHLEQAAAQLLIPSPALDLLAEELRLAQNALGAITGEFSSDDLLGVIFSSFCIGK